LVFCFDGTWNRLDARTPTNVVLTAESVIPTASNGIARMRKTALYRTPEPLSKSLVPCKVIESSSLTPATSTVAATVLNEINAVAKTANTFFTKGIKNSQSGVAKNHETKSNSNHRPAGKSAQQGLRDVNPTI